MRQPTDGEPVKVSSLKRGSATMRSPCSRVIGRMLTAPSGSPVSATISATASMVSGSLDGGLRTIEQPAAMAGASLCAARLSGKLNGLMAGHRADGEAPGDADAAAGRGVEVQRHGLAADALRLLGADAERQHGAVHLGQRVADRLAGLRGQDPGDLLAARLDAGADLAQDAAALVGRQLARHLEGADGRLDGFLVLLVRGVVGRCRPARRDVPGSPRRAAALIRPSARPGRGGGGGGGGGEACPFKGWGGFNIVSHLFPHPTN